MGCNVRERGDMACVHGDPVRACMHGAWCVRAWGSIGQTRACGDPVGTDGLWVEKAAIFASAHLIDNVRFEVEVKRPWDVLAG